MTNSIHQNGNQVTLTDISFQQIVKNKSAFLIWRVENMQLCSIPKDSYGVFFKGDTYLVYNASETPAKAIVQHIHLWIGEESTTDEQGVGAYKMVELDDYLGGAPIQHRECQNNESERFLAYFKQRGGVCYQNGGVATGFSHYERRIEPRLFQLKGKRNIRLTEIGGAIEWASLNRSDAFIVDLASTIFVWNGKSCNKLEKLQAMNKARMLRDDRDGNCNIVIVDDGEEKDMGREELKVFETKFTLREKVSKLKNDSSGGADDAKFERDSVAYLKLYRCSDARDEEDGTVKIKIIEQKSGPLFREDLSNEDSFIIDNGKAGIWVWIGKKSSPKERQEAMRNALGFLQAKGLDERQQSSIKVARVIDGFEPAEFRALFNRWPESSELTKYGTSSRAANSTAVVAKTVPTYFDAALMHANPQLAAESQMLDDGKGLKEIWYVQNFELHKLSESRFGEFYSGDCYIVLYKYRVNNVEKQILYYWIGRKSTLHEQGTAALKTIELDNKLFNGAALQVRVTENKEPIHFMSMFEGRIIIYQGGRASGFNSTCQDGVEQAAATPPRLSENYMLQVKSYGPLNIKAVQVDYRASLLNSNDVFIVCHKASSFFIWCGKGSTGDEREAAKHILHAHKREPEMVIESQERDEFWSALGGKQPYKSEKRLQYASHSSPIARLFEVSNASGRLSATEITRFTQDDLSSNDVMLLDAWDCVFIWIGFGSNKHEREEVERLAYDYLRTDPSQRGVDLPIYKVRQGQEPPIFTGFFGPWDPSLWSTKTTDYLSIKHELQSKNQAHLFEQLVRDRPIVNLSGGDRSVENAKFNDFPKYTYDVLIKPTEELPENIIAESKEVHLTSEDFRNIFKMTYEQFREKPQWKQKEMKRAVRLF